VLFCCGAPRASRPTGSKMHETNKMCYSVAPPLTDRDVKNIIMFAMDLPLKRVKRNYG